LSFQFLEFRLFAADNRSACSVQDPALSRTRPRARHGSREVREFPLVKIQGLGALYNCQSIDRAYRAVLFQDGVVAASKSFPLSLRRKAKEVDCAEYVNERRRSHVANDAMFTDRSRRHILSQLAQHSFVEEWVSSPLSKSCLKGAVAITRQNMLEELGRRASSFQSEETWESRASATRPSM
jgi:hypothetical protein